MERYRVYVMDSEGHINDPPEVIDCPDDEAAVARARQMLDGRVIEVWHGARRIVSLGPTRAPPLDGRE